MYQIFTKVYIPALGNRMLIDLFAHYSNKREDMNKFKKGFDTEADHIEWIFSYGNFKTFEAAKKWIETFKVKGEEYYIMEVYGNGNATNGRH